MPGNRGVWVARVVVVAAIVLFVAPWSPPVPARIATGLSRGLPRSLTPVVGAVTCLAMATIWRAAILATIGAAIEWASPPLRSRRLLSGAIVSALCALPVLIRWPSWAGVQIAPLAIALGLASWSAVRLLRGSRIRALAWFAASALTCITAVAFLIAALLDASPSVAEPPAITPEDRARLQQMLKLAADSQGQFVELRIAAEDLNGAAAAWLASRSADSRLAFEGGPNRLRCRFAQRVLASWQRPYYVNVVADMNPRIDAGVLHPGVTALRIGRVTIPSGLIAMASAALVRELGDTPEAANAIRAISELSFTDGRLRIVADADRASSAFADSMASSPAASDRLRADVLAITDALVKECASLPKGDERFLGLIRQAFASAAGRSSAQDAVEQNRAALVALAIQIGDRRIRRLAGFPANEEFKGFATSFTDQVTLAGRNDLARHFIVSAALRALATADISMNMGLFKEQLDAVDGGSGFSFKDVAADMAGVRCADRLLEPFDAARMQVRMQHELSVAALLPSLELLTEGLSQSAFEQLYGSLADERYRMVIRLIDYRMEACSLLKKGSWPDPAIFPAP